MSTASAAPSASPLNLIDGTVVDRIRQLEFFSRFRVEGFMQGPNKSPFRGYTADFRQHRQYFHGDSLKYLDWRVYAKTERLYIREYEELTNTQVSVILDVSNSMAYKGGDAELSKHDFAIRSAALLFYLAFLHKDSFSLTLFTDRSTLRIPFGSGRKQLHRMLRALVECEPGGASDFPAALRDATAPIRRKGLTIVLSDFMDDPETMVRIISRLRYEGSDVVACQIFDPAEADLDFPSITRFHDLEGSEILVLDPQILRRDYLKAYAAHQVEMKNACQRHGFDHTLLPVADDYDVPLMAYVRHRMEHFS